MYRFEKDVLILLVMVLLSFILLLSSCAWEFMVKKENNNLDVEFFESQNEKIQ
jgi:uncharacterized membrane protein